MIMSIKDFAQQSIVMNRINTSIITQLEPSKGESALLKKPLTVNYK
jgi:hypothetical protein